MEATKGFCLRPKLRDAAPSVQDVLRWRFAWTRTWACVHLLRVANAQRGREARRGACGTDKDCDCVAPLDCWSYENRARYISQNPKFQNIVTSM